MEEAGNRRNVALLIDADNAAADKLDAVLAALADLGSVNVRRVYGNWSKSALKGWAGLVHSHGLEPRQQFDVTKGKNATDMRMTIDAMDLLWSGRIDGFGLMSSDSDFGPLANRIRQDGLPVYGFGRATTPESFRAACTRFIEVDRLGSDVEPRPGAGPATVDQALIDLLGEAWKDSRRDERGFASLSEVGNRAGNRSSFDARNYGFRRLSDLVQAIPNFQTEVRDGQLYLKRVR
ncbi:MAG: NYN domain-containing protein [Sphingomonadaceae bacterium]